MLVLMVIGQVSIATHTIQAVYAFLPGQHCCTYYTSYACIPTGSALLHILYKLCMHSCQVRASLQAAHASRVRLPYAALLTMQSKLAQLSLHPRVALEKKSNGHVDYRLDQ